MDVEIEVSTFEIMKCLPAQILSQPLELDRWDQILYLRDFHIITFS